MPFFRRSPAEPTRSKLPTLEPELARAAPTPNSRCSMLCLRSRTSARIHDVPVTHVCVGVWVCGRVREPRSRVCLAWTIHSHAHTQYTRTHTTTQTHCVEHATVQQLTSLESSMSHEQEPRRVRIRRHVLEHCKQQHHRLHLLHSKRTHSIVREHIL